MSLWHKFIDEDHAGTWATTDEVLADKTAFFQSDSTPTSVATSVMIQQDEESVKKLIQGIEACLDDLRSQKRESESESDPNPNSHGIPDMNHFSREYPEQVIRCRAMMAMGLSQAIFESINMLRTENKHVQSKYWEISLSVYYQVTEAIKRHSPTTPVDCKFR